MNNQGGDFQNGSRSGLITPALPRIRPQRASAEDYRQSGLITPAPPRILLRRLLIGTCLLLFSSLFFIGAVTVIGWIL